MSKVTNYEYFKDELINLFSDYNSQQSGIAVVDGRPVSCIGADCSECELSGCAPHDCLSKRKAWLNAEHIEKPKLTKKERQFCELVETGWIARDKDGKSYYATQKPYKSESSLYNPGEWVVPGGHNYTKLRDICGYKTFSFITWDDKEPWSVEELLKLEVED